MDYCKEQKLSFTRSRPYRKNDNCFVGQKNYSVVRRAVGYHRSLKRRRALALSASARTARAALASADELSALPVISVRSSSTKPPPAMNSAASLALLDRTVDGFRLDFEIIPNHKPFY